MVKAIATDLDGTLFYPKRKIRLMRGVNRRFLSEFVSQGKKLILVTGRNKHVSSKVGKRIKSNELTIIGCNGALIVQNGKVIEEHPIELNKAKELVDLLRKDKNVKSILIFTDKHNIIVDDLNANFLFKIIGSLGMKLQGVYNEPTVFGAKKVDKALNDPSVKFYKIMPWFGIRNGEEKARLASLKYQESVGDSFEISWSSDAVEFGAKGVNKANSLEKIISSFGIDKEEVLVSGDSGNDVVLFEKFPNSFVMSHAPVEVKAKAKYEIEVVADLKKYCN
ncbi:MAG: HAD family phosphatase [Erysipelotrichaceae bacterium]|nr:HAD family phosphatase [Erysipelotrichaceae bacterium]